MGYATAEICLNGHIVSDDVSSDNHEEFCSQCGAKTVNTCPHCNSEIHGYFYADLLTFRNVKDIDMKLPYYCHACGKPYPWTETAIKAATLLIQEEQEFSQEQKNKLIESIPDIVAETPKSNLAVTRFKKALTSAGKFTADGIRQFCIDFACELVIRSMDL